MLYPYEFIDVKAQGAAGDVKFLAVGGAMNSGSTTLTCPGASFTAGDQGKLITVRGAGLAAGTTISSVTNATTVTLSSANSSGGNIAFADVYYGTDDSIPFLASALLAQNLPAGMVYVPGGTYFVKNLNLASGVGITGASVGGSILMMAGVAGNNDIVIRVSANDSTNASYVTIRDLTIDGNRDAYLSTDTKLLTGLYIAGTASITDIDVRNVEVKRMKSIAIKVAGAATKRVNLDNVSSHDNGGASGTNWSCNGFDISSTAGVTVSNCEAIANTAAGISLSSISAGNMIRSSFINQNGTYGISLSSGGRNCIQGNVISGNNTTSAANIGEINLASSSQYNSIVGNQIIIPGSGARAAYALRENATVDGANVYTGNVINIGTSGYTLLTGTTPAVSINANNVQI